MKNLLLALLFLAPLTAHAVPITVQFTADTFFVPHSPVTGTVVYDAASTTDLIDSLISIDLNIDGHTYSLGEVGFAPLGTDTQQIYGLLNGTSTVISSDDFSLTWELTTLIPEFFFFTTASSTETWVASQDGFTQFSVTGPSAVAEPSTLSLFAAGLIALGFMRRRVAG